MMQNGSGQRPPPRATLELLIDHRLGCESILGVVVRDSGTHEVT
jgi:hypothetical protein